MVGADGARAFTSQTHFPEALLSHLPPLHQTGPHEGEWKALSPMARTQEGYSQVQRSHEPLLRSKTNKISENNLTETCTKKM